MRLLQRIPALCAVVVLIGGCAVRRPVAYDVQCNELRSAAQASLPRHEWLASTQQVLETAAKHNRLRGGTPPNILILSSGGENGAFGAGYLSAWNQAHIPQGSLQFRLSDADVITGVSAGAILANFAFIGPETYGSPPGSGVDRAVALFNMLSDDDTFGGQKLLRLVRDSQTYDTALKRALLASYIDDDFLVAIDRAAHRGSSSGASPRGLFVGATDADDGSFKIIDLTRMASDFVATTDGAERQRIKACYRAAIDASSAIPVAFEPAFINNRMLLDGATRWPLFLVDRVSDPFKLPASEAGSAEPRTNIVVFVHENVGVGSQATDSFSSVSVAKRSIALLMDDSMQASIRLLEDRASASHMQPPKYGYAGPFMDMCTRRVDAACQAAGFCPAFEKCLSCMGEEAGKVGYLVDAQQLLPPAPAAAINASSSFDRCLPTASPKN